MTATRAIVLFCTLAAALALFLAGCESPQGTCATGELKCNGQCTDLSSDHEHCGDCGVACGSGQVCFDGACAADCGGATVKCGDRCFDTEVDPRNCGACGVVCPSTNVCSHGTCATSCDAQQTICAGKDGNYCRDLFSDNLNCGACGVVCDAETVCTEGICASTCVDKQTLCTPTNAHAYCASTATDNANCGSCGNVCDPTLGCVAGACSPLCSNGQSACFPQNATPFCTDTHDDPDNCGSCGALCGSDAFCFESECQCLDTKKWCGTCVDTQSDPNNCGSCQNTCSSGTCSRGRCVIEIAANFVGMQGIAADDSRVYLTNGGSIISIPNGGGAKTTLTTGYTSLNAKMQSLVLAGSSIYFTDAGYATSRLCSVPRNGGAVSVLASIDDDVTNIAVDVANIYARGANGIYSMPIGGGSVTTLASSDGNIWGVPAIASDGTTLYWLTVAPSILSVPVGGGTIKTVYTGVASNLLSQGSVLYFTGTGLFGMSSQMSPYPVALNIYNFAVSTFYIYGFDDFTVWRIDPSNVKPVVPIVDAQMPQFAPFAVSDFCLTWWDGFSYVYQVQL